MVTKIAAGCGKRFYGDDWIHIDGDTSFPHVSDFDVALSGYANDSVDVIYSCHLLEYFSRDTARTLLSRWRDKLKTGGILRIAIPDFDMMAALLYLGEVELRDIIGPVHGRWIMNGEPICHQTSWNFKELSAVLESIGFHDVARYDWRKTEHADVDDHSQAFLAPKGDKENGTLISLNIECVK